MKKVYWLLVILLFFWVGLLMPRLSVQAQESNESRHEYKVVDISPTISIQEKRLNNLASEGWELVCVTTSRIGTYKAFLRR